MKNKIWLCLALFSTLLLLAGCDVAANLNSYRDIRSIENYLTIRENTKELVIYTQASPDVPIENSIQINSVERGKVFEIPIILKNESSEVMNLQMKTSPLVLPFGSVTCDLPFIILPHTSANAVLKYNISDNAVIGEQLPFGITFFEEVSDSVVTDNRSS